MGTAPRQAAGCVFHFEAAAWCLLLRGPEGTIWALFLSHIPDIPVIINHVFLFDEVLTSWGCLAGQGEPAPPQGMLIPGDNKQGLHLSYANQPTHLFSLTLTHLTAIPPALKTSAALGSRNGLLAGPKPCLMPCPHFPLKTQ